MLTLPFPVNRLQLVGDKMTNHPTPGLIVLHQGANRRSAAINWYPGAVTPDGTT